MPGTKRIGIDFDNTLIDYDEVFRTVAQERGLVSPGFAGGKQSVRAAVRGRADGETQWQRLQGTVYGEGIAAATMFDGVATFLRRARAEGHEVMIVSHKTEFGHHDAARLNLRHAALAWMEQKRFFQEDGFGLPLGNVHFSATRAEKLDRIARLGITHFIDDLAEVLDDPAFPPDVVKVLFTNGAPASRPDAFAHWREIAEAVLR
jgi:hypothetical protein